LMATEGAKLGSMGEDARRLLLSRMVVDRRIGQENPFSMEAGNFDEAATDALLSSKKVTLDDAKSILVQ